MKLIDKLLISLAFIILLAITMINFFSINQLKGHHVDKYEKYSYAYDCLKEAEITYWDYKCALVNEVQSYIEKIAPSSNLRGYAVVEECEKYNVDICFALAQGEVESHFGTKGVAAKTHMVWNIKAFDNKSAEDIIEDGDALSCPNKSIEPYLQTLLKTYLVNKTEEDLMQNFVDINGNRYASNPNYENLVFDKYNYIKDNTKIIEYYLQMKSWANKCNR